MDCQHSLSNQDEGHVLPCRHKICLSCVREIKGLLEGEVFSCPKCGNCSQYVKPEEEVYGKQGRYDDGNTGSVESNTDLESGVIFREPEVFRAGDGSHDVQPQRTTEHCNRPNSPMEWAYTGRHEDPFPTFVTPKFPESGSPKYPNGVCDSSQPVPWYQGSDPHGITRGVTAYHPVDYENARAYSSDTSTNLARKQVDQPDWIDGTAHSNCVYHNKPVYYFCKSCSFPVCAACKNDVRHEYHNIFDMEKGEGQSENTQQYENKQLEAICGKHHRPFIKVCSDKQEFLCEECLRWTQHSCGGSNRHTSVENYEEFLKNRIKVFQEKLSKLSESEEDHASRRAVNLTNLLEETENLEKQVNDATEKAMKQLETNRLTMIRYIKRISEEKVNNVGTSAEVSDISGFIEEAKRMSDNTQQFIGKRQCQEAFKSHWQMVETVNTITAEVKKRDVKVEKLGLRLVAKGISGQCTPNYANALIRIERK